MSRPRKRKTGEHATASRNESVIPKWMRKVSTAKLERLWLRDNDYGIQEFVVPVRSLILVHGAERFFNRHRNEILFGKDVEYEMQCRQRRAATKQQQEQRAFIARVMLRFVRERRLLNCFGEEVVYHCPDGKRISRSQFTWHGPRVIAVRGIRVMLRHEDAPVSDPDRDIEARIGAVRKGYHLRIVHTTNTQHVVTQLSVHDRDLARCARLDSVEATIIGAENERKRALRLADAASPFYAAPPIATFLSDTIYDQNVWRDILAFL